jgi:hypothetical protein
VRDYLEEIRPEKKPEAVRNAELIFNAFVLPELGDIQISKLTTDRMTRWRNANAMRPRRLRTKCDASEQAHAEPAKDEDARRRRKATANRILRELHQAMRRLGRDGASRLACRLRQAHRRRN